jgi:hypothetical protein
MAVGLFSCTYSLVAEIRDHTVGLNDMVSACSAAGSKALGAQQAGSIARMTVCKKNDATLVWYNTKPRLHNHLFILSK